jgi:indolepyruvate ferredoxin oxidoreductase
MPAAPLELLARLKFLRGTWLDIFGYTAHRRRERALRDRYLRLIDEVLAAPGAMEEASALLSLPETVRGYEGIKDRSIAAAMADLKVGARVEAAPGA